MCACLCAHVIDCGNIIVLIFIMLQMDENICHNFVENVGIFVLFIVVLRVLVLISSSFR